MAHELIIVMNVTDRDVYAQYRAGMRPILERFGGSFRYDLVVAETLVSTTTHPITRVFALQFPDRAARDGFFADPEYLNVRERHFNRSVSGFTVVCEHDPERPAT